MGNGKHLAIEMPKKTAINGPLTGASPRMGQSAGESNHLLLTGQPISVNFVISTSHYPRYVEIETLNEPSSGAAGGCRKWSDRPKPPNGVPVVREPHFESYCGLTYGPPSSVGEGPTGPLGSLSTL